MLSARIHKNRPTTQKSYLEFMELRAWNALREPPLDTVLDNRSRHSLIEINPLPSSPEALAEGASWVQEFIKALRETDARNIIPTNYISLTPTKEVDMDTIYGSRDELLKNVKGKYNPQNVFNNALQQFGWDYGRISREAWAEQQWNYSCFQ